MRRYEIVYAVASRGISLEIETAGFRHASDARAAFAALRTDPWVISAELVDPDDRVIDEI